MAFVVRSEKKFDFDLSPTGKIGPAEYFKTHVAKSSENNFVPFNSSSERDLHEKSLNQDNVGPGSYFKNNSNKSIEKLIKKGERQKEKEEIEIKYMMSKLIDEKRGKVKEQEEQKNFLKNSLLIGTKISNKSPTKKSKKGNLIFAPREKINQISSIPSKNHFGYFINNENGEAYKRINPLSNIYYSGDKDDSVAPDYYYRTLKAKVNALDWSKMSARTDKNAKVEEAEQIDLEDTDTQSAQKIIANDYLRNNINENLKTNDTSMGKEKTLKKSGSFSQSGFDSQSLSMISTGQQRSIKNFLEKNEERYVKENLFNLHPGPGYYDIDDSRSIGAKLRKQMSLKNFPSGFTSLAKRECSLAQHDKDINTGPGMYYNSTKPAVKSKRVPLVYYEKPEFLQLYMLNKDIYKYNVGPGSYEMPSKFDGITKETYVGNCEVRFPENKFKTPGPGQYLGQQDWVKEKEFFPMKKQRTAKKVKYQKFETPGVGSYRNDAIGTIQYKVQANANIFQSLIAPFNSATEKKLIFKSKSSSDLYNPGPGTYNVNNFNTSLKAVPEKKIESVKPLEGWVKEKAEDKSKVGPGSYLNYDYNNWNKKSFNVLFV